MLPVASSQLALYHESFRDLCLGEASEYRYACVQEAPNDHRNGVDLHGAEARERTLAGYHDAMADKYRRGARYPWLPVEPELPEPEEAQGQPCSWREHSGAGR